MRRCALILLILALVVTGCGRVAPQPTATPSGDDRPALIVGSSSDETAKVVAELYVAGLAAKGRQARVVQVDEDANSLVSGLMSGEVDLAPAFAWSAAQNLQVDADGADSLVSDLAAALDGEVAVLQPSKVDRAWRYLSGTDGKSLDSLKRTDRVVGSTRWRSAPDGPKGLAAIYRARPEVSTVDDGGVRRQQVQAGAIGAFDGADPAASGLQPVADPLQMVVSDPQVALLRINLSNDDVVLDVIQQLHAKLDNRTVAALRTKAATAGLPAAVGEWLKANPLT